MPQKTVIVADKAPAALGPYSAAIRVGDFVYCSGQTPIVPETGELREGCAGCETDQCLKNITAVLEAAGLTLANVVKTTVFLTDMNDFAKMNSKYAEYFTEPFPARSTIQVAALPMAAHVEIEVVAVVK
jgi:2-iminobutanoate/2-iminopropanoate deaminase